MHACGFPGMHVWEHMVERCCSGLWYRDMGDLEQVHRCVLGVLKHLLAALGSTAGHHGLSPVANHRTLISPAAFIVSFPCCKCKVASGTLLIS